MTDVLLSPNLRLLADAMSERALQDAITHSMRVLGWRSYHTWNSSNSAKGFPDICAVRGGRIIFFECKAEPTTKKRGVVSAEQQAWIDELAWVPGVTAMVVRPSDWLAGVLDEVII